jgi:hypothetical protein
MANTHRLPPSRQKEYETDVCFILGFFHVCNGSLKDFFSYSREVVVCGKEWGTLQVEGEVDTHIAHSNRLLWTHQYGSTWETTETDLDDGHSYSPRHVLQKKKKMLASSWQRSPDNYNWLSFGGMCKRFFFLTSIFFSSLKKLPSSFLFFFLKWAT